MGRHIVNQVVRPTLMTDNTLHVIGVVSNPVRYHSRYRLAREFVAHMKAANHVRPYVVEAAFGDRHHEIVHEDMEDTLLLRHNQAIWCKENMINLGIRRLLPKDWKYVAWVDMDVEFRDPHWAQATMDSLQHYQVMQPWSDAADLGPNGEVLENHKSLGSLLQRLGEEKLHPNAGAPYKFGHPGYAWACTRKFYEAVNGLVDFAILGSADHHMAFACLNRVGETVPKQLGSSYHRRLKEWEARAWKACNGQVGFIPGRIEHHFHGSKKARGYQSRWEILQKHGYDPDRDLSYDEQGMVTTDNAALNHAIHKYNLSRNEDSVDP